MKKLILLLFFVPQLSQADCSALFDAVPILTTKYFRAKLLRDYETQRRTNLEISDMNAQVILDILSKKMSSQTLPALKEIYEGADLSIKNKLATEILREDPYFIKLTKNGTDVTAITLFLSRVNDRGTWKLPYKLALVRVFFELDPAKDEYETAVAAKALAKYRVSLLIQQAINQFIDPPKRTLAWVMAWNRASHREHAQESFENLLKEQVTKFGNDFSKAAFERASILIAKKDFSMSFLSLQEDQLAPFKLHIEGVRDSLRISDRFNAVQVYRLLKLLKSSIDSEESYESYLAKAFNNSASSPVYSVLWILRNIIELEAGMHNEERLIDLLGNRIFMYSGSTN